MARFDHSPIIQTPTSSSASTIEPGSSYGVERGGRIRDPSQPRRGVVEACAARGMFIARDESPPPRQRNGDIIEGRGGELTHDFPLGLDGEPPSHRQRSSPRAGS